MKYDYRNKQEWDEWLRAQTVKAIGQAVAVAIGILLCAIIAALNAQNPKTLFNRLKQERLNFIDRICQTRPQNKKYRKGWLSRINSIAFQ